MLIFLNGETALVQKKMLELREKKTDLKEVESWVKFGSNSSFEVLVCILVISCEEILLATYRNWNCSEKNCDNF